MLTYTIDCKGLMDAFTTASIVTILVSEGTNSSSLGCCIYDGLFHCAMQLLKAQTSAHEKGHQLQDEKGID